MKIYPIKQKRYLTIVMSSVAKFKMSHLSGVLLSGCLILTSCQSAQENNFQTGKRAFTDDVNVVVTSFAKRETFYKEFENNGALKSNQRAQLSFGESGKVVKVNATNGQLVHKGDVLVQIEDVVQRFNYEKACRNVDRCKLSFEESLINQGYTLKDSAIVPENVMKMALIRSGYQDAINDRYMANHRLKETKVIAPFDGVIADLEAKPDNETSLYKYCCTLIDNSTFEVSFPMLESEISQLQPGMKVEVIPFAFTNDTLIGKLSEINPKVEDNGMVNVKALVINKNGKLVDGMNVKVMVKKEMGKSICVPKEAVTLRQERNVVFVAHNDTAYWRYVDVGETNSTYSEITNGIGEGEQVVIEGNFNLAHLSPIQVINSK
ncbi:MAG: efflux RND transporter periplasmic adaptor subunit [Marinilabiliaceae bacterium]|nr:efflux RND transporter periplasmic adaptor subunit [Marinilabiliaceae bacterium]